MTSIQASTRQVSNNSGYYMTLTTNVKTDLYSYNHTTGAVTAGATWASNAGPLSNIVNAQGALLKDMGKTVVANASTFRKVQLVVPGSGAGTAFGVSGAPSVSEPATDFATAYICLGLEGAGVPTKVVQFGR